MVANKVKVIAPTLINPPVGILHIGVDEVGYGAGAGPMIAASCVLNSDFYVEGVKDSKQVNKKKMHFLADAIKEQAIDYSIGIVEVDEMFIGGMGECHVDVFKRALERMKSYEAITYIDGKFLSKDFPNCICEDKADGRYMAVAAASILAKSYRMKIMAKYHEKYPHYDFINNDGYLTVKHHEGIMKYGPVKKLHRYL